MILALFMRQYGISWREVWTEWTAGQTFLFLNRLVKQTSKKREAKAITERELSNSAWMNG